ncbi:MAG: hypothetical protein EA001_01825 [Oscillatoriales cyanobacterium]|nr:MAG: hypothetical protein EA001_01825 [Oscillatoriales cyanobacterium]
MPTDRLALLAVTQAIGFQTEELALLNSLLDGYWANPNQGDQVWLVDDDPQGSKGLKSLVSIDQWGIQAMGHPGTSRVSTLAVQTSSKRHLGP